MNDPYDKPFAPNSSIDLAIRKIPAAILNTLGYQFEYESKFGKQTPDWFNKDSSTLMESFTFERGGSSPFLKRINCRINKKCERYLKIVDEYSLNLIVSIYLDFGTGVRIEKCLNNSEYFYQIFKSNPSLRGILLFDEGTNDIIPELHYRFRCLTVDNSLENINRLGIPCYSVAI